MAAARTSTKVPAPPRPGLAGEAAPRFARGRESLRRWFAANRRMLPWRAPFLPGRSGRTDGLGIAGPSPLRSPYAAWVSEIMLQQTQVATVAPRFGEWMRRFPDVAALAAAPEGAVLRAWAGLGYYARARNLHRGAKALLARGEWPRTAPEWREIPGVGDYTSGAVASIAFGGPEPILDGNVVRVFSRLLLLDFLPGDGAAHKRAYWELARAWADAPDPGTLNEALMELGALVCTPVSPRCPECPLRAACAARKEGRQAEFPPRKRRARVETVPAVAVVATAGGRVLLEERARGGFLAGHAMFPFFLGPEAEDWEAAFRKRYTRATMSRATGMEDVAGVFRHAIMAKRYDVEVRIAKLPAAFPATKGAFWHPIKGLAEKLTNSLARKVWDRAGG